MSNTISRVTAAMTAIHNENSISLANLNVDFTLIKLEAPPEFLGVGRTISHSRKRSAEDGSVHKTARKLGALFASKVPSTSELYRAYGKRVSEISQSATANPQPTAKDGLFASYVGADSTSLWAAVTSGEGAIGVHLLACMLARMWNGPEATSVWDELVTKRKEEISEEVERAVYPSKFDADVCASTQELTRDELALWDASARSWIESADKAKAREHKQLILMLDNINVPVNSEKSVYSSVMVAWSTALVAPVVVRIPMDCLVRGMPQQVQDAAALLGMSSWHLYPDMVILGTVTAEVKQGDQLFLPTALLTLGLQFANKNHQSVSWSLPLAHMRYYGHPVWSQRALGQENSRISMDEFAYIVLGAVFGGWMEYGRSTDDGLSWLLKLLELLDKFSQNTKEPCTVGEMLHNFDGTVEIPWENVPLHIRARQISDPSTWMGWLFIAAQRIIDSKGIEKQTAMQLVALGRRRTDMLCPNYDRPLPLFGLSDPFVLIHIISDEDLQVKILRHIARRLKLSNTTHIIRYRHNPDLQHAKETQGAFFEFASVLPVLKCKIRENAEACDRPDRDSSSYARWLPIRTRHDPSTNQAVGCVCEIECSEDCQCLAESTECSLLCKGHGQNDVLNSCGIMNHRQMLMNKKRSKDIVNYGEYCFPLYDFWDDMSGELCIKQGCDRSYDEEINHLCQEDPSLRVGDSEVLELVLGAHSECGIYAFKYPHISQISSDINLPRAGDCIPPEIMETALRPEVLNLGPLIDWLSYFNQNELKVDIPENSYSTAARRDGYGIYTISLRASASATEVYKLLPGATVSTSIASRRLWLSKWIRPEFKKKTDQPHLFWNQQLFRGEALACIALFDSGSYDLDPDGLSKVFALSSGNSIYVAAPLLCDPHEMPLEREVRRVVGNIGRPGLAFLIPPTEPKIRKPNNESWMHINHAPFDGKIEDCFQQTTIHLGFTAYNLPLRDDSQGDNIIDRPASLVETIISVHDRGQWVADLDVISALEYGRMDENPGEPCGLPTVFRSGKPHFISVDNWDEFLEAPSDGILVIRAHENWLARLAFTVLSVNRRVRTIVLPNDVCWACCKTSIEDAQRDLETDLLFLIC
ncbi:hypothetical protein OIDMADRAFT_119365 [Oidiodendron maius Zn]|uniref:Uncharacterized protein n=1 Tax=Oidiodendron maius (strain Zn) TaxID=913774 RepID=A0A0C3DMI1_OIDMZ|nr:hypothetical protein OIDMADRAFT_119365 [Oidiodendron maius Zn]